MSGQQKIDVTHYMWCWVEPFTAMWDGIKTFEVRRNDRKEYGGYKVGHKLYIQEKDQFSPKTGRVMRGKVTYLIQGQFGLPADMCVMAIEISERKIEPEFTGTSDPLFCIGA